jgi:hypothetical protein
MRERSRMMEKSMEMMKNKGPGPMGGGRCHPPSSRCGSITGQALDTDELAKYATPELRTLFEDWLLQLEEEIVAFTRNKEAVSPEEVAGEFKLSRESAIFILDKLAQKGRISIDGASAPEENDSASND